MPAKRRAHLEIRGIRSKQEVEAVADLYGKAFGDYARLHTKYRTMLLKRVPRE